MIKNVNELLEYEKKEQSLGYKLIAGCDEVGRGPLAGPVVCACVIMPLDNLIEGVFDSKQVSIKNREKLSPIIMERAIAYSIFELDEKAIDELNILNATKKCMAEAVNGLKVVPDCLLVDALHLDNISENIKQTSIIHGDALSYNIACASIIAKVYRDRLMDEYAENYPEYGFEKNKGYGTKEHINAIKKFGICKIHRKTFVKHFLVVE